MRGLFKSTTLLCFSPPVMLATIAIELGLAVWVATRYVINHSRRLILVMLVCLAGFQLAEFNVCGSSTPDIIWSRIGYIFITLLPPLGIHLIARLRGQRHPALVKTGYLVAGLFGAAFAFLPTTLNHGVCTGNYVIFRLAQPLAGLYSIYYLGLVFAGLVFALWPLPGATRERRTALNWVATGYVAFAAPTFIINFLLPLTRLGIPSIMCGFAVIFAGIAGLRIAPLARS